VVLVIFSKLAIEARPRAWIEDVRRAHDPQQRMVEPHVTLVFPFDGLSTGDVLAHAEGVARGASPIPFRLSQAAAVRDVFDRTSHLFLLPTEGEAAIRALHAQLHSGVLAAKLHPTAVYAPHVTVGAFERHEDAERAAAALPAFDIRGMLNAIQLADYDGTNVTELRELAFG
jgi:2'-5' RNA ligase